MGVTQGKSKWETNIQVTNYTDVWCTRWGMDHNTVTLVGLDEDYIEGLVEEVEAGVRGTRITVEGEDEVKELKSSVDGVVEAPAEEQS